MHLFLVLYVDFVDANFLKVILSRLRFFLHYVLKSILFRQEVKLFLNRLCARSALLGCITTACRASSKHAATDGPVVFVLLGGNQSAPPRRFLFTQAKVTARR